MTDQKCSMCGATFCLVDYEIGHPADLCLKCFVKDEKEHYESLKHPDDHNKRGKR